MARPRKEIDADEVFKLAKLGCTQEEIGDFFGCSHSVISERFRREFDLGRAASKTSLRRWQMKRAHAGSDAMLIHLGKQELGQGETIQHGHDGKIKIEVEYIDVPIAASLPPPGPTGGEGGSPSV